MCVFGSYILIVSFRRLFKRKGSFSISIRMLVGIGLWWIKSNISL